MSRSYDIPQSLITITVHGGLIQHIAGIPEGVTIRVLDYDCEGEADSKLDRDDDGEPCVESIYEYEGYMEQHGARCAQRFSPAAECDCGKAEQDAREI